jgi:hypothetical protein
VVGKLQGGKHLCVEALPISLLLTLLFVLLLSEISLQGQQTSVHEQVDMPSLDGDLEFCPEFNWAEMIRTRKVYKQNRIVVWGRAQFRYQYNVDRRGLVTRTQQRISNKGRRKVKRAKSSCRHD